jgi:phytoene synthase
MGTGEDYAECRRIMRQASKNYSFAANLLPRHKRHHVEALYALMREGDDRVDVAHAGFTSAQAALQNWRELYWRAFETGHSPHPVMRAYLNTALECHIPPETMAAYFAAMQADLTVTRFTTFSDLLRYMDGSAIPVGRAMIYILGVRAPELLPRALAHADSLAIAMQLSNFWRDIGEDWRRGRIYLPQEDLERFNVTEADIASGCITANFARLMEFEIERTEQYYRHAESGVKLLAAGRWGVMSGLKIYRAILHHIRRQQYNVYARRAGASPIRKTMLAMSALWDVLVL